MNLQQKKDNSFLATEPLGRLLLKLSLPTVTAQVINMLYNIVDRIYIGHIPETGALALTGVGVCMPLIMIVSAFAALVGNGGAPRASIFMGKGDNERAEKVMGSCTWLLVVLSVILTGIMLIFGKFILLLFGAPPILTRAAKAEMARITGAVTPTPASACFPTPEMRPINILSTKLYNILISCAATAGIASLKKAFHTGISASRSLSFFIF